MRSTFLKAFVLAAMMLDSHVNALKLGGTTKIVGNSGVSAQLMFLQSNGQVSILDKVENNPVTRPNSTAPAYSVFYNYNTNTFKTANVSGNTFCAGGGMLGDGRWIVTGGNAAVGAGNADSAENIAPYYDESGATALRFLSPCSGSNCAWTEDDSIRMDMPRWYNWVEPMQDGSAMIIGGMRGGGFVDSSGDNQANYEFYPPKGGSTSLPVLSRGQPLNLYPISYLMGDNRVFVSANQEAILWNLTSATETELGPIPVTPRNYPAGGGSAMLPMTFTNNYKQTILFCGGTNLGSTSNWGNEGGPATMVSQVRAETNCAQISPLTSANWANVDPLPIGRSMGQFINLPDGTLWFGMGVATGVAGYTTDPNNIGKPVGFSFADHPVMRTMIYNPTKPAGKRWSNSSNINVPRLYHSSATLLPDSSILIAGSNPNPDVTNNTVYNTEYRVERWYPSYYDQPRPSHSGVPSSLGYGGAGFTLTMPTKAAAQNTKVVIIRTGFVTHGWAMGQRMLQLKTSVSGHKVKVSAMPANPALFAPGFALAFVVVNGIPSTGKFIMIGNGQIGPQPIGADTTFSKRQVVDGFGQPNSLSNSQIQQANNLVNAINGNPVQGVSLPTSVSGMLQGINQTIQAQVDDTIAKIVNGTIPGHLYG